MQVLNPGIKHVSFEQLESRLKNIGKVSHNEFMLDFKVDSREMVVFPDGRVIVKNAARMYRSPAGFMQTIEA